MSGGDLGDKLRYLIEEFERSPLRVVHIRRGDIEIYLSRDSKGGSRPERRAATSTSLSPSRLNAAPNPEPGADAQREVVPLTSAVAAGCDVVSAPNIGTFYRSPKPGAPPFIQIGEQIKIGQELCLIEVMKLFTSVRSEVAGKVEAILVEDGAMVEAGQPLFAVRAD